MITQSAVGPTWREVRDELFAPEEVEEIKAEAAIINAIIEARKTQKISQTKLAEMSGVAQPVLSRMEQEETDPRLSTITKVLASLGLKLAVVEQ